MGRTADDWARLGRIVRKERKAQGFRDTKKWADAVGRSSRVLLGLERGEPTGYETLELVSEALNKDSEWCQFVLDDRKGQMPDARDPVGPGSEASGFVAKSSDSSLIPTRTGNEQGLREEIARVRQEMDDRFNRLEDDVRAIREAVVRDDGA